MKENIFFLVNLLQKPKLTLEITEWAKKLEYVSSKRIQMLILVAILTMRKFGYKQIYYNVRLAAFIFELDNFIDKGNSEYLLLKPEEILGSERFESLLQDSLIDLPQDIISEIRKELLSLLAHDIAARDAENIEDYLNHAAYSIGLPTLVKLFSLLENESSNSEMTVLGGKIIRVLSDISTDEKDRFENKGNNLLYIIQDIHEAIKLRDSLKREFDQIPLSNHTSYFLSNLVNLSFKFYKPTKDFEL